MQEKDVEILEANAQRKLFLDEDKEKKEKKYPYTHRNVRRRLFVDDDDEQEKKCNIIRQKEWEIEFIEQRNRELEEAKKRWNFDFKEEKILPGRYAWVKLDKDGNEIKGDLKQDQATSVENGETKGDDEKEKDTITEQTQAND